jgi:hypothetical protein
VDHMRQLENPACGQLCKIQKETDHDFQDVMHTNRQDDEK